MPIGEKNGSSGLRLRRWRSCCGVKRCEPKRVSTVCTLGFLLFFILLFTANSKGSLTVKIYSLAEDFVTIGPPLCFRDIELFVKVWVVDRELSRVYPNYLAFQYDLSVDASSGRPLATLRWTDTIFLMHALNLIYVLPLAPPIVIYLGPICCRGQSRSREFGERRERQAMHNQSGIVEEQQRAKD